MFDGGWTVPHPRIGKLIMFPPGIPIGVFRQALSLKLTGLMFVEKPLDASHAESIAIVELCPAVPV